MVWLPSWSTTPLRIIEEPGIWKRYTFCLKVTHMARRGLSEHWNPWLSDSKAHVLCPWADTIPPGPHRIMATSGGRCQRKARCQELLKPQGERGKEQIVSKGKYILLGSEEWIGDCWPESKEKGSPSRRNSGGRCPEAWECMPHSGMASSPGKGGVQENVDDGWGWRTAARERTGERS